MIYVDLRVSEAIEIYSEALRLVGLVESGTCGAICLAHTLIFFWLCEFFGKYPLLTYKKLYKIAIYQCFWHVSRISHH